MPIKGITDREERFPEIGQIRKGAPKNDKGYVGKDLDYFRVEFDEQEKDAAKLFNSIYGDKPQEIIVVLAFDEVDRVWDAYLEAYTAGRMVARSDGEKYLYLVDTKTGEVVVKNGKPFKAYVEGESVGTITNETTKKVEQIKMRPVGRLRVVIPELRRLAYLTVLTTSIHDIVNISSQIKAIAAINGTKISGIRMTLKRRPKEISTPRPDGSRARYTKWLLSIEADPDWVGAKLDTMHALSMPEQAVNYLPPGDTIIKQEPEGNHYVDDAHNEDDDMDVPGDIQEGDFEDTEHAPLPEKESTGSVHSIMSYQEACDTKGSGGERYGNLSNDELQGKKMGILRGLKASNLDATKASIYENKLMAIKILLAVPEGERLERAGQPTLDVPAEGSGG